jgi:tRNA threonylcarbamoyladenosine biosynthesis protein TsaB
MNLLAIDSCHSILSVAVSTDETIHFEETEAGAKHSELVMELIDRQIKKARLSPFDLDGVLCMGGPGSFTGLRIGYSIAKGLALSLSIPFASVPTLDCMAFPCRRSRSLILAAIEARKNTFFYAFYRGDKSEPEAVFEDAQASRIAIDIGRYKEKVTLTGTGAASLYDSFSAQTKKSVELRVQNRSYSKEIIAIAKIRKIMDNDNTAFLFSGPEYIRKTDAELNLLNVGN